MPTATSATSLTSDSSATASIMPGRCSVASTWRVPNRIANSAISAATYSAGSPSAGPLGSCPASTTRLMATALYCSARYGTAAISAMVATRAASGCERPKREAMKSAIETVFWLCATLAMRSRMRQPNSSNSIGPR